MSNDNKSKWVGKKVKIPHNLTTDPWNRRGEEGVIIAVNDNEAYIQFKDKKRGTYEGTYDLDIFKSKYDKGGSIEDSKTAEEHFLEYKKYNLMAEELLNSPYMPSKYEPAKKGTKEYETAKKQQEYSDIAQKHYSEYLTLTRKSSNQGNMATGASIEDVNTPEQFKKWASKRNIKLIDKLSGYEVGDEVMFTNEAGIVFGPYTIIGIDADDSFYNRRFYLNKDSYWFPSTVEEIKKYNEKMGKGGLIENFNKNFSFKDLF